MNDLFIQGLTIDWNRVRPYNYVRQIPAISGIDTFTFHKPITFFVGENGSGKSTLLEAIAVAYGFNAEGGTKNYIQRNHTFTLSDDEGTIKTEQIQPLWGTVKVSGDCDTEVVFTDVETGEKYRIGYITQGVTERIKLERGKWYKVVGRGNLTLNPVNIRVE